MKKRRLGKRLLGLLMAMVMAISFNMVVLAAPVEEENNTLYVDGINQFFSKNFDGTMTFDMIGAENAGYTEDAIDFVAGNVALINELILTEGAILGDDFSATLYLNTNRAARGESKVVINPYGPTQIYMNSEEAHEVWSVISAMSTVVDLIDIISDLNVAKGIVQKAIDAAYYLGSLQIGLYKAQLRTAESSGKGIVINVMNVDPTGSNMQVWIHSQ